MLIVTKSREGRVPKSLLFCSQNFRNYWRMYTILQKDVLRELHPSFFRHGIIERSSAFYRNVISVRCGCGSCRNLVSCSRKAGCCHLSRVSGNTGERALSARPRAIPSREYLPYIPSYCDTRSRTIRCPWFPRSRPATILINRVKPLQLPGLRRSRHRLASRRPLPSSSSWSRAHQNLPRESYRTSASFLFLSRLTAPKIYSFSNAWRSNHSPLFRQIFFIVLFLLLGEKSSFNTKREREKKLDWKMKKCRRAP